MAGKGVVVTITIQPCARGKWQGGRCGKVSGGRYNAAAGKARKACCNKM